MYEKLAKKLEPAMAMTTTAIAITRWRPRSDLIEAQAPARAGEAPEPSTAQSVIARVVHMLVTTPTTIISISVTARPMQPVAMIAAGVSRAMNMITAVGTSGMSRIRPATPHAKL